MLALRRTKLLLVIEVQYKDMFKNMQKLPVHVRPFPEYPGLHVQLYDSLVLLHTVSALQLCVSLAHSSMSERKTSLNYLV